MRNWIDTFLDIKLPLGHVDPDSNSSPIEAMYEAYAAYRDDKCFEKVGFIWLSSRDSGKTLCGSILNTLYLLHFKSQMVHLAATRKQSEKALQYCNGFIRKLRPYIEASGRTVITESKSKVQLLNEDTSVSYIDVIVANLAGGNCISPETIVWTKTGPTEARNIGSGDELLTYDIFSGQDVYVKVGYTSHTYKPAREVQFDDGSNLVVSDDHLIFTDRGWKASSTLRKSFKVSGTSGPIINTEYDIEREMFTNEANQLLLGTLMGDASIANNGAGVYRYCVSHCTAQVDYLHFIKKSLEFAGYTFGDIRDSKSILKGKHYCTKQLLSKTHSTWKELRDVFYIDGKKVISKAILDQLTWEGVAYWFMDDGTGNRRTTGDGKDQHIEFAICGFDQNSRIIIRDWFIGKGIDCKLKTISNSSGKQYEVLSLTLQASRQLSQHVGPYILPCLRYKLLPTEAELATKTIDVGETATSKCVVGMHWSAKAKKRIFKTQHLFNNWMRNIKSKLNCGISAINPIGYQHLVDIHIDTDIPHLKSFYANSMKLIHNSEHVPVASFDELDTLSPQGIIGYKEAKLIPTRYKGKGPLTIKYSTRKFAFGVFEQEIQDIKSTGEQLLRWNIIDITEHCPPSRNKPESTLDRWIAKDLPLSQLSQADYDNLALKDKSKYEKITAYSGCASCSLLPVCKMRLAHRPVTDVGGLFKEVEFTKRQFKITDPDMAAAQLLCWKPSSMGLIYPRFEEAGNILSLEQAFETFTGEKLKVNEGLAELIAIMHLKGIKFTVSGDWGHSHATAFIVNAVMPSGDWWIFDAYSVPGLEFDDILQLAMHIRDTYKPARWFMDTAEPMFLKTFRKNRMPCANFTKDVLGGIGCVRTKVVDATGRRRLKIIRSERTEIVVICLKRHHFKLNSLGLPTADPDDDEIWSDIGDSLRYAGQNLFKPKGEVISPTFALTTGTKVPGREYLNWDSQKIRQMETDKGLNRQGKSADGSIAWDFGTSDDE